LRVSVPSAARVRNAAIIFRLTFASNNLIYESHCDLLAIANLMSRENQSMKYATKKAAKKAAKKAPKKAAKKTAVKKATKKAPAKKAPAKKAAKKKK
jgi:hypothetical protein